MAGLSVVVAGVFLGRLGHAATNGAAGPTTWTTGYEWFDRMTSDAGRGRLPGRSGGHAAGVRRSRSGSRWPSRPETAAVADVPSAVTRAFYQARYGGRPPVAEELDRMAEDLDRLQAALRTVSPWSET